MRGTRQLGTVSNRLNARQSKIFTQPPPKDSIKLLKSIRCLLRNVKRFRVFSAFENVPGVTADLDPRGFGHLHPSPLCERIWTY